MYLNEHELSTTDRPDQNIQTFTSYSLFGVAQRNLVHELTQQALCD